MTDSPPIDPIAATLTAPEWRDRLDTIVHIGAGTGAHVAACLATSASRILLVEALPANRTRLERLLAEGAPRLQLVSGAIAAQAGTAQLNLYKPAAMSSLRTATGQHELFPGLSLQDRCKVTAITPSALLEDLPAPGTDALIVQQPGEEGAILEALCAMDGTPRFDLVCVTTGVRALYEGAWTTAQIRTLLEQHGYVVSVRPGADPDRPCLVCSLDRRATALAELGAETVSLRARLAEANQHRVRRDKEIAALTQTCRERDERIAALTQIQTQAQDERDARIAALTQTCSERDARIRELEQKLTATRSDLQEARVNLSKLRDQVAMSEDEITDLMRQIANRDDLLKEARILERDAAQMQAELSRMTEERAGTLAQLSALAQQLDQRDTQIAQMTDNARAAEELLQTRKDSVIDLRGRLNAALGDTPRLAEASDRYRAQMEAARIALDQAQAEQARLRTEVQAARKAGAAAARLHAKNLEAVQLELERSRRFQTALHIDLRDLQARYAEQNRQKARQEELLRQLTPRLQEAARHLEALDAPAARALAAQAVDEAPPKAPAAAKGKAGRKAVRKTSTAKAAAETAPKKSATKKSVPQKPSARKSGSKNTSAKQGTDD